MKEFVKILAGVLAALALVWVCGRYGWKLLGFRACGGSGIDSIEVTDQQATIHGFYPGSFPSGCVGTLKKQKGDILYIGVRYDPVFGVFETGQFTTMVALDQPVKQIYLKAGDNEYEIWSAEELS